MWYKMVITVKPGFQKSNKHVPPPPTPVIDNYILTLYKKDKDKFGYLKLRTYI
jgi:hypothetical protein